MALLRGVCAQGAGMGCDEWGTGGYGGGANFFYPSLVVWWGSAFETKLSTLLRRVAREKEEHLRFCTPPPPPLPFPSLNNLCCTRP